MKGRLIVLRVNGGTSTRELDKPPPLEEMQAAVGGYIELVSPRRFSRFDGERAFMFCNEEGKLKGLPLNIFATELAGMPGDPLVGDVVIIAGDAELMSEL